MPSVASAFWWMEAEVRSVRGKGALDGLGRRRRLRLAPPCFRCHHCKSTLQDLQDKPLNIVLLDGTWSNSAALYRRLKEKWTTTWGEEDLPCLSLSTLSASVMHKLRPQPAWDRTCTAAAAAGLLWELHMRPELSTLELGKQAEAVECSLDVLLDALTARRLRLGRSITRKQRHRRNCM